MYSLLFLLKNDIIFIECSNRVKQRCSGVLSVLAHLKMKLNRVVLSRVFKNLPYKFSIKRINPNQSLVTTKDRFGLFSSGGIDALAKELADD